MGKSRYVSFGFWKAGVWLMDIVYKTRVQMGVLHQAGLLS